MQLYIVVEKMEHPDQEFNQDFNQEFNQGLNKNIIKNTGLYFICYMLYVVNRSEGQTKTIIHIVQCNHPAILV